MKIAGVPDISLLTDFVPNDSAIGERVLILHYPSGSVAEVLQPKDIKHYDGPRRDFEMSGNKLSIILHRGEPDSAEQVFDAIVEAHHRFQFWMNTQGR